MKKKSQHLLLVLLLFCSGSIMAQSTLNAASNRVTIQGQIFEYSVGEMTLVNTERNPHLIVTQGYLQPASGTQVHSQDAANGLSAFASGVRVYPNPTSDWLNMEFAETTPEKILLLDASGKTIQKAEPGSSVRMNLSALASGNYFLMIYGPETLSYKIQKLN